MHKEEIQTTGLPRYVASPNKHQKIITEERPEGDKPKAKINYNML